MKTFLLFILLSAASAHAQLEVSGKAMTANGAMFPSN